MLYQLSYLASPHPNCQSPGPTKSRQLRRRVQRYSGGGIRTRDLRVMSPTSYQAAPPRDEDFYDNPLAQPRQPLPATPSQARAPLRHRAFEYSGSGAQGQPTSRVRIRDTRIPQADTTRPRPTRPDSRNPLRDNALYRSRLAAPNFPYLGLAGGRLRNRGRPSAITSSPTFRPYRRRLRWISHAQQPEARTAGGSSAEAPSPPSS